jgi:hypothetical protein
MPCPARGEPACASRRTDRTVADFVDSATAKVDIGSLYLQALQRANSTAANVVEAKPTEVQAGSLLGGL